MSSTLKAIITKLRRRRRRSQEESSSCRNGGENKQSTTLTREMAGLNLSTEMDVDMVEPKDAGRYDFGSMENYEFTFETESTKTWPGPPYDENARFAPGVFDSPRPTRTRVKQRTPKRKLSQQDHGNARTRSAKLTPVKLPADTSRSRRNSRPIQFYGCPPPRSEPLRLLNIPAELRNQIYRFLCVHRDLLIAQYKPIMLPHRTRNSPNRVTVRRFPREPVLALGNVQLRDEVLSIFYKENKFVIRPTENLDLLEDSLFFRDRLERWTPAWGLFGSLRSMEVRFTVRLPAGGKMTVNWSFKKVADRAVKVSMESEVEDCCLCFDEGLLEDYRERIAERDGSEGLVSEVGRFIDWRQSKLEDDDGLVQVGTRFRPTGLTCEGCGKEHLRALEQGL